MTNELKSCPFCSHSASVRQNREQETKFIPAFSVEGFGSLGTNKTTTKIKFAVRCCKCKAMVGYYASEKTAIEAWNRRANND